MHLCSLIATKIRCLRHEKGHPINPYKSYSCKNIATFAKKSLLLQKNNFITFLIRKNYGFAISNYFKNKAVTS